MQVSSSILSLQMDEDVKEIVRMLVRCAYESPLDTSSKIPSHSAYVEVAVRENAFNPLSSPSVTAQRDERIYVAFQQHIIFQVGLCSFSATFLNSVSPLCQCVVIHQEVSSTPCPGRLALESLVCCGFEVMWALHKAAEPFFAIHGRSSYHIV